MDNIKIKSLGPIKEADINFGDLTLFVGPQASGKSILLQLIKLLIDKKTIRRTIEQYGFVWGNNQQEILDRYFGEGMAGIWTKNTRVAFDKKDFLAESLKPKTKLSKTAKDELFYIPAQRVVCLQNGWPRFFSEYDDSVPYILRDFSETLRQFLESGINKSEESIFPQPQRIKQPLIDSINNSIFHNGKIVIDKTNKKRLKLNIGNTSIPFMAWSAGQKEFMPLLLSFYYLSPVLKTNKDGIKYVIIEEPEMGLHPEAIKTVLLQILDLLSRNYKVIVSTHSPVLLEFAWAFNILKEAGADKQALYDLFDVKKSIQLNRLFKDQLELKKINTYYFDRTKDDVTIRDISSLDAGSEEVAIAEWGGLSSFSSKANDIVSTIAANNG
ncbi:ATP-binding protein [Mucilaginibacter rubeus]|uniref:ATP-binding protein n=1 Tax=Mucilaginibacter rubeus TaxID=2027860 RepID=A0AAE6JHR5_9SPHI|nr:MULTISPECIES: AAA family ATPase [Mucilaginibacter]QEM05693.1 ATP-binding protein [Mucilaginibacter rubeus]QEM18281.1 ATP-binding protein [Mucilaginibacter gossypii]QTE45186.1 ATP-binding protein [Mucilaginibacter rubeus]QTE51782.1 ATP-binding protein [Mucilaginibacter rubeus]QTE56869.1 ATP-binding protein [Mucilaginibacter rubeus]